MYLQTINGDGQLINASQSEAFWRIVSIIHEIVTKKNGCFDESVTLCKPVFDGNELYLNQKRPEYSNIIYNESAYLENWNKYMKYLSGTVGTKLLILELGVSLDYPMVIRWPFEKMVFINRKSHLIRVHNKLYQHTPEIAERTDSVKMDSVDFVLKQDFY